ncbi:DUF192 domain-containing protein [Shimia abyssi]|uniref:DUF192 domain-containing protein n=1 Tax=Shimia abyssi TaxID=1662395 RepID=A0A2P8FG43_9RHOB|nr:DUF192 domain-containing protein [Shimia abyssi]PSL20684.1 hypothetical protein CLV88_103332 [Shimia abyssi]
MRLTLYWRRTVAPLGALILAIGLSAGTSDAACSDASLEIRGDWGQARFSVEVADTERLRNIGLMHRTQMPSSAGMLFVYDRPGPVSFWMRNTLIPLDMLFADETGVVRRVHSRAVPLDETAIPGGNKIQYVLEINGGLAEAMGIVEGSQMRHPAIAGDVAAWPCGE